MKGGRCVLLISLQHVQLGTPFLLGLHQDFLRPPQGCIYFARPAEAAVLDTSLITRAPSSVENYPIHGVRHCDQGGGKPISKQRNENGCRITERAGGRERETLTQACGWRRGWANSTMTSPPSPLPFTTPLAERGMSRLSFATPARVKGKGSDDGLLRFSVAPHPPSMATGVLDRQLSSLMIVVSLILVQPRRGQSCPYPITLSRFW